MSRADALLVLVVFAVALLARLHPIASESFQYDAVTLQLAAREGIFANAMDRGDTYSYRRSHPPLAAYVAAANNAVLGGGPFAARVYSILAGSLTAALVTALGLWLLRREGDASGGGATGHGATGHGATARAAAAGGLLLALLPVHLYVSKTAGWDALYGLLSLASLGLLARHLVRPSRATLVGAGVVAALALLTCEIAVVMGPAIAVVMVLDARARGRRIVVDWVVAGAAAVGVGVVLWPAAVLEGSFLQTLSYRLSDSGLRARNAPWYGFYVELWEQSWSYVLVTIAGLVGLVARRCRAGGARELLPFLAYAATVVLLSFRQRLVYLHHIADLFAPLTVLATVGLAACLMSGPTWTRRTLAAAVIGAIALLSARAIRVDPDITGPQEHPGFIGTAAYLADHPDATVHTAFERPLLLYSGRRFGAQRPRRWSEERLHTALAGDHDLVVTDWSMFSPAYPDRDALTRALAPTFALAHEVTHRRTGEPVAWVYRRVR